MRNAVRHSRRLRTGYRSASHALMRVGQRQAGGQAERAQRRGHPYARHDPYEIFERDGWQCVECGIATPKALRDMNRMDSPLSWIMSCVCAQPVTTREGIRNDYEGHAMLQSRCEKRRATGLVERENHSPNDAFRGWIFAIKKTGGESHMWRGFSSGERCGG